MALLIGFYNYTVVATYIGLIFGVCGIYFAYCSNPELAVLFLMLAGFCDMFDGKIAQTRKNRTKSERRFGVQIDSLSDVVSFGVLPAVILMACKKGGYLCPVISFAYVLACVIRLAYFNVTEEERQDMENGKPRVFYLGLPVTSSAIVIPIVFCFKNLLGKAFPSVLGVCMAGLALLFLTPFKLRKLSSRLLVALAVFGFFVFTFIIATHFFM